MKKQIHLQIKAQICSKTDMSCWRGFADIETQTHLQYAT